MATRTVKVSLSAQVADYNRAMSSAAESTRNVGSEGAKLTQTREAFQTLGRTSLAMGVAVGAGVAVAVGKFADFDQAMSNVAATGDDARNSMDALRAAALDAGSSTVFTATESANAIEELAKAGLLSADILGGALAGSLDLAAAGGLGVADAAGVAATALQQFQLDGGEASHVADLLAAGAGKAMGDVSDMGQALNQAGLVANQFGLSIEETVGTLSAFASAGMIGSDAGTSMRTMLLRLANPTEEVKDLMKGLGIEAYDASGNFVGMAGLAGELETGLAGMTQAQKDTTLAMIFGQDAIRGANILLREGSDGIDEWTAKVDDQGYAAETAATRLDNLKGDVEKLTGALDSAFITMGGAADGPLRLVVQSLTGLVDKFNELPDGAQQAVLWVGAAGAAALTAYGSYMMLVPKIAEYNSALATMGGTAQKTGRALAGIGKGIGIVAAVGTAVTIASDALIKYGREVRGTDDAVAEATTTNQSFTDAMDSLGVTTNATSESVVNALDAMASGNVFGPIGGDVLSLRDALTELDGGMKNMPIEDSARKFQAWGEQLGLSRAQMATMLDEMPGLKDAIREYLISTGGAADNQSILNFALEGGAEVTAQNEEALAALAGQATDTGTQVDGLAEQIRNFGSATLDTRDAQRQFEQAVDDVTASIAENGTTLDIAEQAGRDNQAALDDMATSALELAAATYTQTGSQDQANAVLQSGRDRLIEVLGQFGITGQAAEDYANQLGLIPGNIQTAVALNGVDDANAQIMDLIRDRFMTITVNTVGPTVGSYSWPKKADGGPVSGPGTGTSDSILTRLSNGEHVLTAAEVAAAGGHSEIYRWRQAMRAGKFGFADGGAVGRYASTPSSPGMTVVALSPEDRRLLRSLEVIVNNTIDRDAIAAAANGGNANRAWRGGNG